MCSTPKGLHPRVLSRLAPTLSLLPVKVSYGNCILRRKNNGVNKFSSMAGGGWCILEDGRFFNLILRTSLASIAGEDCGITSYKFHAPRGAVKGNADEHLGFAAAPDAFCL